MINSFIKKRAQSFTHAFEGCKFILSTQKNSWIHLGVTIIVVILGLWLKLDFVEWAIIVLVIGLVWTAEAFNTSIEALNDLATSEIHPLAKISKDVGAAAVLLSAFTAVITGVLILGPHLLKKLFK
jgi:diacylglycerol kinase (ATP)